MSQLLSQGVEISLVGMSLTFASLGLLVLVMLLLERAFRRAPTAEQADQPVMAPAEVDPSDEEIAVAVAVALSYQREQERSHTGLGATLETGRGAYWSRGRELRAGRAPSRHSNRGDGR